MKILEKNNCIILKDYDSFDIEETLECGQCFRFEKLDEKEYKVIAHKKELHIKQENDCMIFYNTTKNDFENIWFNYFDLARDYKFLKEEISKNDPVLKEAIDFAKGIRILNQEPWECLISFIISQNNRIPMIKKVIQNISREYGEKIENEFSFPDYSKLLPIDVSELMLCKTGFRAKYILDAAHKVSTNQVDLNNIDSLTTAELSKMFMSINGVGPKVSDCVMLFSCKREEVFPTDVWVKRIMQHFYFEGKETDIKTIHEYAYDKFGKYAGFAQQYLFHYARQLKIGV